ncbi:MAG: ISL3 family transposase, partial [Acidimicrobiales bacterium]
KTWTEQSAHVDAQVVLTRRAGAEASRQVGELARPVPIVAAELGVCWWTVMNAVVEHGTPLVDDPDRIGPVEHLGVDETSFLAANRSHATVYATGLVDLQAKVVIDMVEGNRAADLRRWTAEADPGWLGGIEVVATDLAESFRAGLSPPHLDHARRVTDPFHVVRAGNRCLDKVRGHSVTARPERPGTSQDGGGGIQPRGSGQVTTGPRRVVAAGPSTLTTVGDTGWPSPSTPSSVRWRATTAAE